MAKHKIKPRVATSGRAAEVLADVLRKLVAEGAVGDALPTVRELMQRHHAGPATVTRALAQLSREGLVVARPGAGTFIASSPQPTKSLDLAWQSLALDGAPSVHGAAAFPRPNPELLSLGSGYPDNDLLPLGLLAGATARIARRQTSWQQCSTEGLEELRAWFARDVGAGARAAHVVITPGGQAALSTIFRAIVPPGGALITESPTYFGALAVARAAGIHVVPVPIDEQGIQPEVLDAALAQSGARAVYLQPTFSNPTGSSLSRSRRADLGEIARRHGAFLIEDDYARDLAFDGRPPAPLLRDIPEHVVYVRSLTKVTAASLRIAAVIGFGPVIRRVRDLRAVDDWFVSTLLQAVALEAVTSRGWTTHLERLRATLLERRDGVIRALAKHLPGATLRSVPRGGFSLWLELPSGYDEAGLVTRARDAGVHLTAGRVWFPAEPVGAHIRISIAGAPLDVLVEGIERLAPLW